MLCALPAQADGPRPAKPTASEQSSVASGVVNLNTASAIELARLPGIGPSKAQAILSLRDRMKRFKRVEDIMRVKGIGRKTFRKLRSLLAIEGSTTLQARAKNTKKRV